MLRKTVEENMHLEISWGCQSLLSRSSKWYTNKQPNWTLWSRVAQFYSLRFIHRPTSRKKKRKLPESIKRTNSSVSPMMTQRNRKSKNRLELQIYSLTNSISMNWKSVVHFSSSDCWKISARMKVRKEKNRLNKCTHRAFVSVSSAIRCVCRFSSCPHRRLSDHLQ